jgi:hypothetical protein
MRLAEIHTSELTADCLRKVQHRLKGEVEGSATTALYRGLVAGRACELMHQMGFDQDPSSITVAAAADTQKQLADENRMLSEAVENNRQDILAEVTDVLHLYRDRFGPAFERCTLIGTEVPARYSCGKLEFASHLDLVVRDTQNSFGYGKGRIIVFDWKWRADQPSHQYLARNMQFALYYMMVKHGRLKCGPEGFEWIGFGEPPVLVWFHLSSLKPYSRRTTAFNDQGEEQEFVKGDWRPTRSILYRVEYDPEQEPNIISELRMRGKMIENDIFPLNPDPVSCRICDAEAFCTRFDTAHLGDSNQ